MENHAVLTALIRRHLPGINASLLASPRLVEGSDDIEWYSDLAGQPEPLALLPADRQKQVRLLLEDHVAAITELADRLPAIEPSSAHLAEPLRQSVAYPGERAVYAVGGQPVLTFWGHVDPDAPVRPVAVAPTAGVVEGRSANRLLPSIPGILALLLAAAALWYWWPVDTIDSPVAENLPPCARGACAGAGIIGMKQRQRAAR